MTWDSLIFEFESLFSLRNTLMRRHGILSFDQGKSSNSKSKGLKLTQWGRPFHGGKGIGN